MVVLQACAYAAPTSGNFILSLLSLENALRKKDIKTIYAFPERAKDKQWCKEIQNRTQVYFLPEEKARIRIKTYRVFNQIYKENNVLIAHSHFELYDIPTKVMAPKGTKVFWHLHDALKENYFKNSFLKKVLTRIQYAIFNQEVTLLSVSEEHALFVEKLGFPRHKIKYIPNGIDIERFNDDYFDYDKEYMLMFGWDVFRKGVDILVEASKMIDNCYRIKVVGQEACKEYLKKAKAPENIEFVLPVEKINDLYKNASIFLHISRAEGFSYALLEALYIGLPVICSDIPENSFAKNLRNVLWIPSENADALSKMLKYVLKEGIEVYKEDIKYNRKLISDHYSINSWTKQVINIYFQ